MEKKHEGELGKGIGAFIKEERHWAEALKGLFSKKLEPLGPGLPQRIGHYGKVVEQERISLALSGLFKTVSLAGKSYLLYPDVAEGRFFVGRYDDGEMGKAMAARHPGRIIDYQTVEAGKQRIVFTVEAEIPEHSGGKLGDIGRCFFRSHRFDGAVWKQLPDGCTAASQKLTQTGYQPERFNLIPVYQPVVLGQGVFVYDVSKVQSAAVPKRSRFDLRASK
jgi:hypothetical protein